MMSATPPIDDCLWIWGYGSLIWKPAFPHTQSYKGFVRGWKRRFYQGSKDHRGTEEKPGRVVTLLPASPRTDGKEAITYGMVYRVEPLHVESVLKYLDFREKGGYSQLMLDVIIDDARASPDLKSVKALTYTATEGNEDYLGPAPLECIGAQIFLSEGPSGKNIEYLLRLAEHLRLHDLADPHVFELESFVKTLISDPEGYTVATRYYDVTAWLPRHSSSGMKADIVVAEAEMRTATSVASPRAAATATTVSGVLSVHL